MKSNVVFKRIAFTGPTSPPPQMINAVAREVANFARTVGRGVTIISGGAFGIDTVVAEEAMGLDLDLVLVVPEDQIWNKGLFDVPRRHGSVELIEVKGHYRDRNERMVRECDMLVACLLKPVFYRSGEWMTKNIATKVGKPVSDLEWS